MLSRVLDHTPKWIMLKAEISSWLPIPFCTQTPRPGLSFCFHLYLEHFSFTIHRRLNFSASLPVSGCRTFNKEVGGHINFITYSFLKAHVHFWAIYQPVNITQNLAAPSALYCTAVTSVLCAQNLVFVSFIELRWGPI